MELSQEQRVWLEMLRIALLEIRALDDKDLHRARDLANIYHNLPSMLFGDLAAWERHKSVIFNRAETAGLAEFIRRDLAHVERLKP